VGIFGALLAGGCYVPIDANTPVTRVKLIINDAEPKVIICHARLARHLFSSASISSSDELRYESLDAAREVLLCVLDASTFGACAAAISWAEVTGDAASCVSMQEDSNGFAYILYTSGSTGRPKGVVHTHRSAMAFIQWAAGNVRLDPHDILSQHASPSFDLTVFDFFCSVLAAATLVAVPEWLFGNVLKTCRFIARNGITVWYSVPSALLREGAEGSLDLLRGSSLRRVIFAGEALPKHLLRKLVQQLPSGCTVSNWYGPTETNVCTFHDVKAADLDSDDAVPIGLPCPFASVRIEPQIDGRAEEGELLVSSATLMNGYWKLDNLTAKVFVTKDAQLYYRTGDIVTWCTGNLLFIGRADRLLKVRGYRVQPEEVERVLAAHPDVLEAVVIPLRENGLDRLAAAVTISGADNSIIAGLKRLCIETLPSYMVPSLIFRLPTLPRGSRGKVDLTAVSSLVPVRRCVTATDQDSH
jgi:amino acid adenylation domain-containing protein